MTIQGVIYNANGNKGTVSERPSGEPGTEAACAALWVYLCKLVKEKKVLRLEIDADTAHWDYGIRIFTEGGDFIVDAGIEATR